MTETQQPKRPALPTIENVRVDVLKPWGKNPRKDHAVEKIARSMQSFGILAPIIVQKGTMRVLAGHGRLQALKKMGVEEVPVVIADLTDEQASAYTVADNKLSELADWDVGSLAEVLKELESKSFDVKLTGFETAEMRRVMAGLARDLKGEEPLVVAEDVQPVTQLGDMWALGEHRLHCGDSTQRATVAGLFHHERACLMFTDPPYGVMYKQEGVGKKNAIRGDITQTAIPISFAVAVDEALDADARVYLCGGTTNLEMYSKLFDHHLRQIPHLLIWVKESFILRPNNYHSRYELIYFGWRGAGGDSKHWYGDRKQDDVWQVARDGNHVHPTQKPVELPARAMRNSAPPGGLVYEPFSGSGSTLMAAEQTERRCYAIELDPRFVDVAVKRWQNFTGRKAQNLTRPDVSID